MSVAGCVLMFCQRPATQIKHVKLNQTTHCFRARAFIRSAFAIRSGKWFVHIHRTVFVLGCNDNLPLGYCVAGVYFDLVFIEILFYYELPLSYLRRRMCRQPENRKQTSHMEFMVTHTHRTQLPSPHSFSIMQSCRPQIQYIPYAFRKIMLHHKRQARAKPPLYCCGAHKCEPNEKKKHHHRHRCVYYALYGVRVARRQTENRSRTGTWRRRTAKKIMTLMLQVPGPVASCVPVPGFFVALAP